MSLGSQLGQTAVDTTVAAAMPNLVAQVGLTNPTPAPMGMITKKPVQVYKCKQCPQTFTRRTELKIHEGQHNGNKPHQCEVCGKCFAYQNQKVRHQRVHTGERPFKCSYCPSAFAQKCDLQKHIRTHTGAKPYKCKQCPKAFAVSSALATHVRQHTGERPFVCQFCGKGFVHSDARRKHERIHTGEKPYKCSYCDRAFTQRIHKVSHERALHRDEPLPAGAQQTTTPGRRGQQKRQIQQQQPQQQQPQQQVAPAVAAAAAAAVTANANQQQQKVIDQFNRPVTMLGRNSFEFPAAPGAYDQLTAPGSEYIMDPASSVSSNSLVSIEQASLSASMSSSGSFTLANKASWSSTSRPVQNLNRAASNYSEITTLPDSPGSSGRQTANDVSPGATADSYNPMYSAVAGLYDGPMMPSMVDEPNAYYNQQQAFDQQSATRWSGGAGTIGLDYGAFAMPSVMQFPSF
eukprot:Clim_evm12s29 gene=Clim_evmTU12s29